QIPATDGRPELLLPDGPLPPLTLPAFLRAGLTVQYSAGESVRIEADLHKGYSGTEIINAHVNFAAGSLVAVDVRRYVIWDPSRQHAVSIGATASTGDEMSVGILWINPLLLGLLTGAQAPTQPDGVKVERVAFQTDEERFEAVRIFEQGRDSSTRVTYDLATGLLLSQTTSHAVGLNRVHVQRTYLSRRYLALPWAQHAPPDWVGQTRRLTYQGANQIQLAGTNLNQSVGLSITLEELRPGLLLAAFTTVASYGAGYPDERATWEIACAAPMLYPLWIAPAALAAMQPHQSIDVDPVTTFRMTFMGIENGYGMIVEEGPLERTAYYFDARTGMFSGMRGQRPYGDGGGRMAIETWIAG
ncbi:MAG: hypothetical protein ABL982_16700, partial [Vicinamibacterales bacterium]